MAKLKKASTYKRLKVAYTRISKKRSKSYIRASPYSKIVSFDLGNKQGGFDYKIRFIAKESANIRHNALEAARVAVNKVLAKNIGTSNYHFKIRSYPHHILRENPLAAGAGADRMSTGMKHSFGKPIGRAARVKAGQTVLEVNTNKKNIEAAKKALNQARYKFAIRAQLVVDEPAA